MVRTHITKKAPKAFVKVLQFYSYTIPFLYICRHLLELSMKAYLERKTGKTFSGHFIKELLGEDTKRR